MKREYIQPEIIVMKIDPIHVITSSAVDVYNVDYDEDTMTDLARESIWGNNEDQTEESKFWF